LNRIVGGAQRELGQEGRDATAVGRTSEIRLVVRGDQVGAVFVPLSPARSLLDAQTREPLWLGH
jgi:hypothetical protein